VRRVSILDPDSTTPMYAQLAAILRERIKSGEIAKWLPSKLSLVQEYGISRATVDEAFRVLREEGLIVTVHGKAMRVR
jgi:DNA-binding GntR family transcriptional regulator